MQFWVLLNGIMKKINWSAKYYKISSCKLRIKGQVTVKYITNHITF